MGDVRASSLVGDAGDRLPGPCIAKDGNAEPPWMGSRRVRGDDPRRYQPL